MKRFKAMVGEAALLKPPEILSIDDTNIADPMGYYVGNLEVFPWKEEESRGKALGFCPEISMIMEMRLERERCPDEVTPQIDSP